MVEYEESPEEIHQQIIEERREEEKKKKKPSFLDELTTFQKILIGAVLAIIVYNASVKGYNVQSSWTTLAIAGAIAYYLFRGGEKNPIYLDEQTLKIELYRKLKWKQIHPLGNHFELPMGEVCIDVPTKERWLESAPWKRVIGFYVQDRISGYKDYWTAVVDIRSGDIKDLKHKYFDGHEAPDLKWIKSPALAEEDRFLRTIGKKTRR